LIFVGYSGCYSVIQMLLLLGLPSFNSILVNGLTVFINLKMNCANSLIVHDVIVTERKKNQSRFLYNISFSLEF